MEWITFRRFDFDGGRAQSTQSRDGDRTGQPAREVEDSDVSKRLH
jgi:hypothetical protein